MPARGSVIAIGTPCYSCHLFYAVFGWVRTPPERKGPCSPKNPEGNCFRRPQDHKETTRNYSVRPSVCPCVCLSVRVSVRPQPGIDILRRVPCGRTPIALARTFSRGSQPVRSAFSPDNRPNEPVQATGAYSQAAELCQTWPDSLQWIGKKKHVFSPAYIYTSKISPPTYLGPNWIACRIFARAEGQLLYYSYYLSTLPSVTL